MTIEALSTPLQGLKSCKHPVFNFSNSKCVFPVSAYSSRSTKFCWQELPSRTQWRSSSACSTSWSRRDSHLSRRSWLNLETLRLKNRWMDNSLFQLSTVPNFPFQWSVNIVCVFQVQKLQGILKPMMLRRLKEDVEKNLAPKEETIIEVRLRSHHKRILYSLFEAGVLHCSV